MHLFYAILQKKIDSIIALQWFSLHYSRYYRLKFSLVCHYMPAMRFDTFHIIACIAGLALVLGMQFVKSKGED